MKYYKMDFSYPDGHIEEFEDFKSLEEAVKYGTDLQAQVNYTERLHDPRKTYFLVYENDGNERKLVYRSK